MFNTILNAHNLLDHSSTTTISFEGNTEQVAMTVIHRLTTGRIEERLTLVRAPEGLISERLHRQLFDAQDERVRNEEATFFKEGLGFARNTYPEVLLPLMMGWLGPTARTCAFYSWINDRFVSRMYAQIKSVEPLQLSDRRVPAFEAVMYPDLNDYVRVGATMARLAKPIMPKYHLWYEDKPPHRVLRFEGSYGPPGAPEVIMELKDAS